MADEPQRTQVRASSRLTRTNNLEDAVNIRRKTPLAPMPVNPTILTARQLSKQPLRSFPTQRQPSNPAVRPPGHASRSRVPNILPGTSIYTSNVGHKTYIPSLLSAPIPVRAPHCNQVPQPIQELQNTHRRDPVVAGQIPNATGMHILMSHVTNNNDLLSVTCSSCS